MSLSADVTDIIEARLPGQGIGLDRQNRSREIPLQRHRTPYLMERGHDFNSAWIYPNPDTRWKNMMKLWRKTSGEVELGTDSLLIMRNPGNEYEN
jgi:hypothetical protein